MKGKRKTKSFNNKLIVQLHAIYYVFPSKTKNKKSFFQNFIKIPPTYFEIFVLLRKLHIEHSDRQLQDIFLKIETNNFFYLYVIAKWNYFKPTPPTKTCIKLLFSVIKNKKKINKIPCLDTIKRSLHIYDLNVATGFSWSSNSSATKLINTLKLISIWK